MRVRRKRMARKGALTCFIVLASFALAGQLIFRLFGITLPAFEIAGGLILLFIGLDMLEARRSPTQETTATPKKPRPKKMPASCRWAFPCSPGPGAISAVMVLVGQVPGLWHWEMGAILGSIAITALVAIGSSPALTAFAASWEKPASAFLVRIMGLLLVALAMQYFVNGLKDLGLFFRH
jgi:multiple antibiotic resistance protein